MSLIRLSGVKKKFITEAEELNILKSVDLEIDRNSTAVITGESGSGKSTLLNIIGGLDKADSGEIEINTNMIMSMNEKQLSEYRKNQIGFIFQFHYLLKDFTCLENVMMPFYMAGNSKKDSLSKAEVLLERVKLADRLDHYPSQLSGGERQRAALARALINEPEIILADEPTGNLDEKNSRVVEKLLFEMVSDYGKTLLLVTHDKSLASGVEKKYHLHNGQLSVL